MAYTANNSGEDYVKNSKNLETLRDFCLYCINNPEMRFWQALRNWSGYSAICTHQLDDKGLVSEVKDTFYFEGKDK